MPDDWQSSHQRDACLSTPVVAGEKRGDYPPVDCDCQVIYSESLISENREKNTTACLPARNEAPAGLSTARLSRRLASPAHNPSQTVTNHQTTQQTHITQIISSVRETVRRETSRVHQQGDFNVKTDILDNKRRSYLQSTGACLAVLGGPFHSSHFAYANDSTAMMQPDFGCLLDLPPLTPDCARIYLCRHGQTENNRLHLVQGARVDPPINENGREQAKRLGTAISRLMASDGG
eukprot:scaffold1876_cov58-Cyclotella_meneghiniana.AAC.1